MTKNKEQSLQQITFFKLNSTSVASALATYFLM